MSVRVEVDGAVRVLSIARAAVHNCIDADTAVAIAEAIAAFAADDDAHVLVVTGDGDEAFCTGADLKAAGDLLDHPWSDRAGPIGFARLDPGKPTIAAVNGYCFAGGMELAAWCDIRIAAPHAEFGALNRRWGVPFIDGGTQRFPRIVGLGNALYLIETGVRIDAQRALEMGFVQEVVPDAKGRALELAHAVAAYPQASIRTDREATVSGTGASFDLETRLGRGTLSEPQMAEGLRRFAEGDRSETPRG